MLFMSNKVIIKFSFTCITLEEKSLLRSIAVINEWVHHYVQAGLDVVKAWGQSIFNIVTRRSNAQFVYDLLYSVDLLHFECNCAEQHQQPHIRPSHICALRTDVVLLHLLLLLVTEHQKSDITLPKGMIDGIKCLDQAKGPNPIRSQLVGLKLHHLSKYQDTRISATDQKDAAIFERMNEE